MTQICHAVYMNNVNQSAKRSAVTGDIPLYQDETPTPFYLSDLEFDILLGLACQETPDDIASALKMSVETITSMKLRLRAKLKAMSNTQAVERACYLGLI